MNHKILFVKGDPGASGYYRMDLPAQALRNKGYNVTCATEIDPRSLTCLIDVLGTKQRKSLLSFDAIVFQLVWVEWLVFVMQMLNEAGKFVILEIDDDYYNIPPTYPGFRNMHPYYESHKTYDNGLAKYHRKQYYKTKNGKVVKKKVSKKTKNGTIRIEKPVYEKVNNAQILFQAALDNASLIQCTTPELAEIYNGVVLENCINNKLYENIPCEKDHKEIIIGWYGANARIEDLRIVKGAIPDNAKLFVAGASDEARKYFDDIETMGFFKPHEIPDVIARCDIGIAPLQDNKFNAGKSDLKGLEFAAGFIPVVASNVAPYKRFIEHGQNGFIAKNGRQWVKYLNLLVDDADLRHCMGIHAKEKAIKRDIENNIYRWVEAYNLTKDKQYAYN